MISALKSIAQGKLDESVMTADALGPIPLADAQHALQSVGSFAYAGSRRLPERGLTIRGHRLVDYAIVALEMGGETKYLTLYRDDHGKIAWVVPM
jgi:hypothetical protein